MKNIAIVLILILTTMSCDVEPIFPACRCDYVEVEKSNLTNNKWKVVYRTDDVEGCGDEVLSNESYMQDDGTTAYVRTEIRCGNNR